MYGSYKGKGLCAERMIYIIVSHVEIFYTETSIFNLLEV